MPPAAQYTFDPPTPITAFFSEEPTEVYDWLMTLDIPGLTIEFDPVMMVLTVHTTRNGEPYTLTNPQYDYIIVDSNNELYRVPRHTFETMYKLVE